MTIYTWEEFCKPENFCTDYFENTIIIDAANTDDVDYLYEWRETNSKGYSSYRYANSEKEVYSDLASELSEFFESVEQDLNVCDTDPYDTDPYFIVKKELTEGKRLVFSLDALPCILSQDLLINKILLSCVDLGFEVVSPIAWKEASRHLFEVSYKEAA